MARSGAKGMSFFLCTRRMGGMHVTHGSIVAHSVTICNRERDYSSPTTGDSSRYPTPGSVMSRVGWAGSSSILRRSRLM